MIKLDSTMLKAHMSCPKSFYWRYVEHLTPSSPSAALEFGGAVHKGLEVMHKTGEMKTGIDAFLEAYPEDLDNRRTQEVGKAILSDYFMLRHHEFSLDLQIEVGFAYEVRVGREDERALMVGRIDRIRKGRQDENEIWISDWKTASRIGPSYINKYIRDLQMGIYYLGCQFSLGQCDGVAIDVLPVMKKSTIPQLYEYDYSPYDEQILSAIRETAGEILQGHRHNFWPERWTHCDTYSGCPYQDLCYNPNAQEQIKDTLYAREIWEPWKGIINEENDDDINRNIHSANAGTGDLL